MSKYFIGRNIWEERFKDWHIVDVALIDSTSIVVCLRKVLSDDVRSRLHDTDVETRMMTVLLDKPNEKPVRLSADGFDRPIVGACTRPSPQALIVSRNSDGQVFCLYQKTCLEENVDAGQWPMVNKVKKFSGLAYAISAGRRIYRRSENNLWEQIGPGTIDNKVAIEQGFTDMDRFEGERFYAVGGDGEVWYGDEGNWQKLEFPNNVELGTVTCGGDGFVYITGEGGSIWKGHDSNWELIHKGKSTILWNDAVWFDSRLWLSSDYQLRVLDEEKLSIVTDNNGDRLSISGHMDAVDGLLCVASSEVVKTFNGNDWQPIIGPYLSSSLS